MHKKIFSFKVVWLVYIIATIIFIYLLHLERTMDNKLGGPEYDLIFGVHTYHRDLTATIEVSPYVIDGQLHLSCEKINDGDHNSGSSLELYRYHSKTRSVELLPLPSLADLNGATGRVELVYQITKHINLNTDERSPDGYVLAEPGWVKAGLVNNIWGNIALFLKTGKLEQLMERESVPRFKKGSLSIPLTAQEPILRNEAETAFLIGWITPVQYR